MQRVLNKKLLIAFILFTGLVSLQFQCNKRIGCGSVFNFEMGIKAYPDKEIFSVGDTLWLEAKVPTQLQDKITERVIDFSGAENLGISINYDELIGNHDILPSADSFDYVLSHGNFVPDNLNLKRNRDYRFSELNQTYHLKLGIIMKKKGVFKIAIGNSSNVFRKNDKCTKAFFEITFIETNQHLFLYQNNKPGYVLSEYDKTHVYAFKVN